jgi:hypothetical protein
VFGWRNKSNPNGSDLLLKCLDGRSKGWSEPGRGIFGEDAGSLGRSWPTRLLSRLKTEEEQASSEGQAGNEGEQSWP